jgi:hypothetical protein
MTNPSAYYVARKPRLLKEFDMYVKYSRAVLVRYFGGGNINRLVAETRQEFENLIPQFPYIGGKQPFTQFVVAAGLSLAMYRIAKAHGKTVEETGELLYEIGKAFLKSSPAFLVRLFGRMNFSRFYLNRLRKRANESHQRKFTYDYVFNFIEGDGKDFDYGVDYLECASCKFLTKQDAPELAPYLCPVDILYSDALGWGLMRTTTLAEGADRCDFRFKRGGSTRIAVPVAMQQVIVRSE